MSQIHQAFKSWEFIAVDVVYADAAAIEPETIFLVPRGSKTTVQEWLEKHLLPAERNRLLYVFPYPVTVHIFLLMLLFSFGGIS